MGLISWLLSGQGRTSTLFSTKEKKSKEQDKRHLINVIRSLDSAQFCTCGKTV